MTDPRIQARRVTVARQQGRSRRRRILFGLAATLLCVLGLALVHSSLLGARHVQVFGAPNIETSTVIAAAGLKGAPPLVDLDPASIASRVERLPWVLSADVRIAWPSTVAIDVTERTPVAAVSVPGASHSYAICDVTGRVLEVVARRPRSLPVVALGGRGAGAPGGPGSSLPPKDRTELEVAAAMPESMVAGTNGIYPSADGVLLALKRGPEAIVGGASSLYEKFVALATVLAHGGLNGAGAIDLRVPSAPVLLPKGPSPIVPGILGG